MGLYSTRRFIHTYTRPAQQVRLDRRPAAIFASLVYYRLLLGCWSLLSILIPLFFPQWRERGGILLWKKKKTHFQNCRFGGQLSCNTKWTSQLTDKKAVPTIWWTLIGNWVSFGFSLLFFFDNLYLYIFSKQALLFLFVAHSFFLFLLHHETSPSKNDFSSMFHGTERKGEKRRPPRWRGW